MEKTKTSKKELRSLINDSLQEAVKQLALPTPSKKVKKLLGRNAKRLAALYAHTIKRENKKKQKAEKFLEQAVTGKPKKDKKKKLVPIEA